MPFSISKFIADGVGVTVPTKQLFKSLVLTLLIPLILGKVYHPRRNFLYAEFVDAFIIGTSILPHEYGSGLNRLSRAEDVPGY